MGLIQKLFGKKQSSESYMEKDNMGTRHDSVELANAYWVARNVSRKTEPYVLYIFENEKDAQNALLDLDCIHLAEDTGNLICTETLLYGHYRTDAGKYEAVICGNDLTHEMWKAAKESFTRHNGKRRNDKEPEKRSSPPKKAKKTKPGKVIFVREDRHQKMGDTFIYRIHKAPDADLAKVFLEQHPVTRELYYIIVETPEGNYCRDIQGIYKE